MKRALLSFLLISQFAFATDPVKYVNPMIGTGGVGHTYPGATVPFGMVQVSPDTRIDGSWEGCSGYHHSDSLIYGFSHTHLSGTGCSDYGDVLLMPVSRSYSFDPKSYASAFDHASESASPGYYSVTLKDHNIRCEVSATTRTGMQVYTYPEGERAVLLDLVHRDKVLASSIRIVNDRRIDGFRRSEAWARDQYVFFSIEFSEPFQSVMAEGKDAALTTGDSISDTSIRLAILFKDGKELKVKTGISSVSESNASMNLQAENPGWDFARVKNEAEKLWNKELGKIEVYGANEKSMVNFYTSLYHTMIVPNVYSDIDGRYRGRDGKIHTAKEHTQYTVFSLWDTFRAAHPLYVLLDKKRTRDFIRTFIEQYEQSGRLPVWELSANETDCMIGFHSVSVIADAIDKGVTGFDVQKAYEAMKASANGTERGLQQFNRNYFLQLDDESESVSKALEYAYDNWCVAVVARHLNKEDEAKMFEARAAAYINMYDPVTGFMRPRRNGNWYSPFDPREVNNHYTEANSYQYSFFVPQDIPGMIDIMGGPDEFDKKLDGLFNAPAATTGRTQADITGMIGQYAHGNEPSHHMAYLYNYIGKPWKTQALVRRILDSLYIPSADGLPGNEDCGQMSAWYVWSALGFYPVTPGNPYYALGSPLFEKSVIHLENGDSIVIDVQRKNPSDQYVQSWKVNGKEQSGNLLNEREVGNGGRIEFLLSDSVNTLRGNTLTMLPPMNKSNFVAAPFILTAARNFTDSMSISISSDPADEVYYFFNTDSLNKQKFNGPFFIKESCTVHAFSKRELANSGIVSGSFFRLQHPKWKVALMNTPNRQYSAEGPMSMIDGVQGSSDWRKGDWHGYQSQDMIVEIAMDKEEIITSVSTGFLQDTRSWIVYPKSWTVQTSMDGSNWLDGGSYTFTIPADDYNVQVLRPEIKLNDVRAKFIRVHANNFGVLPSWHAGAGYDAFIFSDEISVSVK